MTFDSRIWLATLFSYADRLVAFALPLLVLKWLERPDAYVAIEYVLSLSVILATFFDAGLGGYVLYHFRLYRNLILTTTSTIQAYAFLYLIHVLATTVSIIFFYFAVQTSIESNLICLAITRACALSVIRITTQLLIMHGKGALTSLLSLTHWTLSAAVFVLPSTVNTLSFISLFFGVSILVMAVVGVQLWLRQLRPLSHQGLTHIGDALAWGWPTLLSAAASMLVMNFSKVYAYSQLPSNEMIGFAFWLRIFSVVQLTHVALMSVLSLEIYQASSKYLISENLRRYLGYLGLPLILAVAAAIFPPFSLYVIPLLSITALVLMAIYVFMWCISAYLENYLTRDSLNVQVLVSSIMALAVYALALILLKPSSVESLVAIMCFSSMVYFIALVISMRKFI